MPDAGISVPKPLWPEASLDDLLALARQKYDVEFEPVSAGGVTLEVAQVANMKELLDAAIAGGALENAVHTLPLWAKVWPASLVLGHVFAAVPRREERSLLELGAGCGVSGLVAAALGFSGVCVSDIDEDALLFARINAVKNGLGDTVDVVRLDVAADSLNRRFSVLAASELLYLEPLYRPLLKCIKRHLALPGTEPEPQVFLAADHRRSAKPFFRQADKEFNIAVKPVGVRESEAGEQQSAGERAERHLLNIYRLTHIV